jgi:hypothetical protein
LLSKIIRRTLVAAACACVLGAAPPTAAEDVFIIPDAFTTQNRDPFGLSLTESDRFPNLGRAPANAPGRAHLRDGTPVSTTPIEGASGDISTDPSNYSAWSLVVDKTSAEDARYIYEPERRGWVKLRVTLNDGAVELAGEEARAFLQTLYLTPEERASFVAPAGPVSVNRYRTANAYVCVRRCDTPGVISYRSAQFQADPTLGLRAFTLTYDSRGIPDLPVELVTATDRRELRTDASGGIVIPDDVHGIVMLSIRVRRPPAPSNSNYSDRTSTLTFELP